MKVTKVQLKQIIKEEIESVRDNRSESEKFIDHVIDMLENGTRTGPPSFREIFASKDGDAAIELLERISLALGVKYQ